MPKKMSLVVLYGILNNCFYVFLPLSFLLLSLSLYSLRSSRLISSFQQRPSWPEGMGEAGFMYIVVDVAVGLGFGVLPIWHVV
jgi:hypothetical protein